jgi:hypothetical protein
MATIIERFRLHPKRDKRLVVPLTEDELRRLRERARAAGAESAAGYVRVQALQEKS